MRTLQRLTAVRSSIYNHFIQDRHLNRRDNFKDNRSAALAEWRQLCGLACLELWSFPVWKL